jgi:hypothetical protein
MLEYDMARRRARMKRSDVGEEDEMTSKELLRIQ